MPYAIERFDSNPVIKIFLSARYPIASIGAPVPPGNAAVQDELEQLLEVEALTALEHAAGEPAVAHAELRFGIGIDGGVNDHGMPDHVVGLAGANRQTRGRCLQLCPSLVASHELRQIAGALLSCRRVGGIPHGALACRIGRAAVSYCVVVETVRPGEQLDKATCDGYLVAALSEADQAAHGAAVLRGKPSDGHRPRFRHEIEL